MLPPVNPPDPTNPDDPMYQFIDEQPEDQNPDTPDSSLSHFTVRQFTPEAISATWPVVVTKTNHGLVNGEAIRATKFYLMPFARSTGMYQLNNRLFYVRMATTNTFELCDSGTIGIDGRSYTPYIQGGQFTLVGQTLPIVNPSEFPPAGTPLVP
jgi:hypothetical protein